MLKDDYLERDTPVRINNRNAKIADLYYKPNEEAVYSVIFEGELHPKGRFERSEIEVKR